MYLYFRLAIVSNVACQTNAERNIKMADPVIVFSESPIPDKAIIHDTDTFQVQWKAFNAGQVDSPEFTDLLVITNIPEGCPGSDDQDHPVVYDSETDGDPQDFLEQEL